jgi:hypothetical protein
MPSSFVAYIDESGDEGFVFLPNEKGSSRWFVISAAIFRTSKSLLPVEILKGSRVALGKPPKTPLHFRHLKHEQRVAYVAEIAKAPMRTISICVHKPSIDEPERYQHGKYLLYKYVARLLIERISWLGADYRKAEDGDGFVDLIFSDRAAMSYTSLQGYLLRLRQQSEMSDRIRINWDVIDPSRVKAVAHEKLAGLQIADAVASSHFYALNLNPYGHAEARYVEMLRHQAYRGKAKRCVGYGHKFWPDLGPLKRQMPHLAAFEG